MHIAWVIWSGFDGNLAEKADRGSGLLKRRRHVCRKLRGPRARMGTRRQRSSGGPRLQLLQQQQQKQQQLKETFKAIEFYPNQSFSNCAKKLPGPMLKKPLVIIFTEVCCIPTRHQPVNPREGAHSSSSTLAQQRSTRSQGVLCPR